MDVKETIKKRAEECADGCYSRIDEIDWARCRDAYEAGATSLLPALEILAKFAENYEGTIAGDKAISKVKALGIWPLPDAGKGGW